MHRIAVRTVLGAWLALMLLCGVGGALAWRQFGADLVMPGAAQVEFERNGIFRVHVSYRLPEGKHTGQLVQFLRLQGWRRVRTSAIEPNVITLVRQQWAGRLRDVLLIVIDAEDRRMVDLRFGRCVRADVTRCF